ncbi:MAG: helix-turn-helix domain-containing protein, partial [Planctomycetota bacterium JB042]
IDPAEDVLGARARRWRERIGAAPTVDAALGALRGALARALERHLRRSGRPAASARAVRLLAASHGALPIDALAAEVGLSRRQLERTFLERVGVSPKRYARSVRFAAVVAALEEEAPPSLARIAAEFGYADQPHLNRDFRELAGCSPRVFRAERNPWNASFVTGSS